MSAEIASSVVLTSGRGPYQCPNSCTGYTDSPPIGELMETHPNSDHLKKIKNFPQGPPISFETRKRIVYFGTTGQNRAQSFRYRQLVFNPRFVSPPLSTCYFQTPINQSSRSPIQNNHSLSVVSNTSPACTRKNASSCSFRDFRASRSLASKIELGCRSTFSHFNDLTSARPRA